MVERTVEVALAARLVVILMVMVVIALVLEMVETVAAW